MTVNNDSEMEKEKAEIILKNAGVSPTAMRILVWRCLDKTEFPLSLADIENELESVDKSTISRTLSLFRDHHIVHAFNDGSGSVKYELCRSQKLHHDDLHVHFRCEKCGQTFCLTETKIPVISLPPGYQAHSSNFIIEGICDKCSVDPI